ncbi:zinc ribbon domain-containing protein [Georgenia sp. MJ170]|uniref:zinc ribbon domain-containing protein n=1 Tax=Georgenia sunbinii TaxID=3117728 RepID=UPI002F265EFD
MQTCPECGDRNEDGELFCGSCGTYLEWAESQPAPGTAAAAVEEPAADDVVAAAPGSDDWGDGEPGSDQLGADELVDGERGGEVPVGAAAGGELAPQARNGDDGDGHDAQPAAGAPAAPPDQGAAVVSAAAERDDVAPTGTGGDGVEPSPAGEPAPAEEPAPAAVADKPRGNGRGRVRGGRASGLLRQAADQATGGAASQLGSSASRARSQARNLTGAPGRTAASQISRAAAGAGAPPAVGGVARDLTAGAAGGAGAATARSTAAATKPAATKPAPGAPSTPAATKPAATKPAAARPAAPGPGGAAGGPGGGAGGTGPRKPAARKPGAPVPRRQVPAASADEPQPQPGDLICGACGAGNAPHRNFCRRCGASLADAPVQPQRSWWRRLLRPERRPDPSAGSRPRNRRRVHFPTRLVVVLVVLGLLVGAGWYFRGPLGDLYQGAVDRVAGDNPVNPAEPTASSALDGRPASQARDGFNNVSWAPVTLGDGAGEWIEFPFDDPFRLVTVVVTAGASPDEDQRLAEARPRDIRLSMTTPGGLVVEEATLDDVAQPQGVPVGVSEVSAVRLTILSAYGENLQAPVAVAEVEFRGR